MSKLTSPQQNLMKLFNPDFDNTKICSLCGSGLWDAGTPLPPPCDKCGQTGYCVACSISTYINKVMTYYCAKHTIGLAQHSQ